MIINKLKPFVTSFSEVVSKYDHGTEVTVGGEIKSILVISDFLSGEPDPHVELDGMGDPGVYLTLDDGVGVNNVVIPTGEYERFKQQHGAYPQVGTVVLAVGKMLDVTIAVTKNGKELTIEKHSEHTKRVAAYYLGLVPEHKETSESGN